MNHVKCGEAELRWKDYYPQGPATANEGNADGRGGAGIRRVGSNIGVKCDVVAVHRNEGR